MTKQNDRSDRHRSEDAPSPRWNIHLGRWLGIDVHLHVTFLLMLAFLAVAHGIAGGGVAAGFTGVLFFVAIFGCVLLHEYGHALSARRHGIGTRDITLLPFGGVARLERIPDKPAQELEIALAGPAVNLVIAAALGVGLALTGTLEPMAILDPATRLGFLERLLAVNVFLVLFNLLPAFPMDGGRVLRALLAMRLGAAKATQIAGRLGQVMAVLFAIAGLFGNPMLLFIALFVWMGATAEMGAAKARSAMAGVRVSQAMVTTFVSLAPSNTLAEASREVLEGSQQDFPVIEHGRVVGILGRRQLLDGLTRLGPVAPIESVMTRDFPVVNPEDLLEESLKNNITADFPLVPVMRNQELVGLLTMENISELLMIKSALGRLPCRGTAVPPPLPQGLASVLPPGLEAQPRPVG